MVHPKYMFTVNASRIAQLAHSMDVAAGREEWERAADYAHRIAKMAEECVNAADEEAAKEN